MGFLKILRYNGIFVITGFVITGCFCTTFFLLNLYLDNHMVTLPKRVNYYTSIINKIIVQLSVAVNTFFASSNACEKKKGMISSRDCLKTHHDNKFL